MVPSSLAVMHGVACQAKRTDYGERKSQIGPLNLANRRFLLFQELGFEGAAMRLSAKRMLERAPSSRSWSLRCSWVSW